MKYSSSLPLFEKDRIETLLKKLLGGRFFGERLVILQDAVYSMLWQTLLLVLSDSPNAEYAQEAVSKIKD